MDYTDEIQHREHQRQILFEELKRQIYRVEEAACDGPSDMSEFWWAFVTSITAYIHAIETVRKDSTTPYHVATELFKKKILPQIEAFSPVLAEKHYIATQLLKYAIETMNQPVNREIVRLSIPPARDQFLKEVGLRT